MKKWFAIGMIAIGSFLEILYYRWRFVNDGIESWLSITIGIALTLLLVLAIFQRKYKWAWMIIIPVSLYSVFATSAGQAFSLGEILQVESGKQVRSEYVIDEIVDIESQITWIDTETERISASIDATVNSLEDRGYWRTTLADAESRQRELRDDRRELSKQLSELRGQATQHEDVEERSRNIYEFYGNMFGWDKKFLQFALQTILSVFIAVMAPIGIIVLQKPKRRRPSKSAKKQKQPVLPKDTITRWIRINWIGIRSGKSKKILPRKTYKSFVEDRGESFNRQEYNRILNIAKKKNIVADDGRIIEKNEDKAASAVQG